MSHTNHPPMMTLQQAFELLRARIPAARLVGDGATPLARVHTDTRTLQAGDLFVALKGERFDANSFLPQAGAAGAAAAIAHGGLQAAGLPGIEVPDTLAALGALAAGTHMPCASTASATGTRRRLCKSASSGGHSGSSTPTRSPGRACWRRARSMASSAPEKQPRSSPGRPWPCSQCAAWASSGASPATPSRGWASACVQAWPRGRGSRAASTWPPARSRSPSGAA